MAKNHHSHSALIDAVGSAVVRAQFELSHQRLHAWRIRGVPYAWRAEFARIAGLHGVGVPADFLSPPRQAA